MFMTSTNRTWLILSPIVLFLGAQFGAPLIAGAAPSAFVFTLAITSFVVTGVLTWASVRAERLVVPRVVDHLRQASLLYVSAAVGLVLRFSSSAADIGCFVCPPPWAAVVLPAVAANILVLALVRVRPFAA